MGPVSVDANYVRCGILVIKVSITSNKGKVYWLLLEWQRVGVSERGVRAAVRGLPASGCCCVAVDATKGDRGLINAIHVF